MSNHFPAIPTLELFQLTYLAYVPWNGGDLSNTVASSYYGTGTSGVTVGHATSAPGVINGNGTVAMSTDDQQGNVYVVNISVTFSTPGSAGDFDQDTMEASISATLNSAVDVMASVTGDSTSTAAGWVVIDRIWQYTDSAHDWQVTYTDNMPYTY